MMKVYNIRFDDNEDIPRIDTAAARRNETRSAFIRRACLIVAKAEVEIPTLVSDLEFILEKHGLVHD